MSTICHSLTAGGVPLFFMVSGYLLLGRKGTTYKYVAHKIWAIVRYIAAVCILYWIVMALIHWDYAQVKNCASEFVNTFMLRGPFTPFWFLWTMTVIYLLLPLTHRFYARHTRAFAWSVSLLGVFCILLFAAQFTNLRYSDRTLLQPLKMWKWVFFFALGGVLRAYPAPRMHWGRIAICAAVLNAAQRYMTRQISPLQGRPYRYYSTLRYSAGPYNANGERITSCALPVSCLCPCTRYTISSFSNSLRCTTSASAHISHIRC